MLKRFYKKGFVEAGCDEAGRGCLAGPVVAAAVILHPKKRIVGLDDSKKISEKKRDVLRIEVEKKALAWAVGFVTPQEIDDINILNASFLAMHRAIDQLSIKPELLLIDGNRFNAYDGIEHECIIKGDAKFQSIAAASILAKTHRDELMKEIAGESDFYGWNKNKGYPTKFHRSVIAEIGASEHHRMTFKLLP